MDSVCMYVQTHTEAVIKRKRKKKKEKKSESSAQSLTKGYFIYTATVITCFLKHKFSQFTKWVSMAICISIKIKKVDRGKKEIPN